MKRILIFIGLKLVEVVGIVGGLYLSHWIGVKGLILSRFLYIPDNIGMDWTKHIFCTIVPIAIILVAYSILWACFGLISEWIKWNWERAGNLSRKYRRD